MCIYCRNDRWFDDKIQGNPIFGGEREEGMGGGNAEKEVYQTNQKRRVLSAPRRHEQFGWIGDIYHPFG